MTALLIPLPSAPTGTLPLALTRRALCAFARWRDAPEDRQPLVCRWCGLHEREASALARLAANLRGLEPLDRWLEFSAKSFTGGRFSPRVMDRLLAGLTLPADLVTLFVQVLRPRTLGLQYTLDAALRALATPAAAAGGPRSQPGTFLNRRRTGADSAWGRFIALIDARGIDLACPVSEEDRDRLARELGLTHGSMGAYFQKLRRQRGVRVKAAV